MARRARIDSERVRPFGPKWGATHPSTRNQSVSRKAFSEWLTNTPLDGHFSSVQASLKILSPVIGKAEPRPVSAKASGTALFDGAGL